MGTTEPTSKDIKCCHVCKAAGMQQVLNKCLLNE